MAKIVLAAASSHSPMLGGPGEDYAEHAKIDRGEAYWKRTLFDKEGREASYDELLSQAPPDIADQITLDVMTARADQCQRHLDHLRKAIAGSGIDALIVVGDDQHEQFTDDNMPAILVYWGETIRNDVLLLSDDSPAFWVRARSQYHEETEARDYPVASELGRHVINELMADGFDVSHSRRLPRDRGEGHAFGFVHRRLMGDDIVPMLPICLNTYFPPNQPRPERCYALGAAIRKAVESWESDHRIGILASGGLSHFTVNEELDRLVLAACRNKDRRALMSLPLNQLESGSSEIRNWIAIAGAAEHLDVTWSEYVACYRSEAGTGMGMGFALWS